MDAGRPACAWQIQRLMRTLKCLLILALIALATLPRVSAQDRVRAWQADLDSARVAFLPADRAFSPLTRAAFTRAVAELRDSVGVLSDAEIVVRLARATALSGNAHTRIYLLRNASYLRRYPVRLAWFEDGLYVVRTRPEHEDLLGARVVEIAGRPVADVEALVAPLYAGNGGWRRYMSTYTLTSPDVLLGLGLVQGAGAAPFAFESGGGGGLVTRVLEPLPLNRHTEPTEAWWDLAPTHPGRDGPWVSVLPADTSALPLYLRRPEQRYWFEPIPGRDALYFQFNRSDDMPTGETVEDFGARLLSALEARNPSRFVIDLRFNTGGNLGKAWGLFRRFAGLPLAQRPGGIVAITGPATFSAGLYYAAFLAENTRAAFVGEWPGDDLDFWAEGGRVVLPHSGLILKYTDGFHSYSPEPYPAGTTAFLDLTVGGLMPWTGAPLTADAYFGRRDPALEVALSMADGQ